MQRFFDLPSLNVIWQLVCGRRFEYNDQSLIQMIEHIEAFTMEKYIGPIVGTKGNYNISKWNLLNIWITGMPGIQMVSGFQLCFKDLLCSE